MSKPVMPAQEVTYRVLWYATVGPKTITPSKGATRALPTQTKRLGVFEVRARSVDKAREAARKLVTDKGFTVSTVNVSANLKHTVMVYTREA